MGAPDLLLQLRDAGFWLMADGARLLVSPASALTDEQRKAIREHRNELLLLAAHPAASVDLIAAINRCCDARGDHDTYRAALIDECRRLTPEAQAEMTAHFEAQSVMFTVQKCVVYSDPRVRCSDCRHGAARRCPNVAPLPGGVLHHCERFQS